MPLNGKFLDKSGLTYFWSKLKDLLSGKVDKETGKGLSTNDYTTAEKTKLNGIETGANKTIVDSAMSSSSTSPVQNKVINAALSGKQNTLTFDSTPTDSSTNPVTSGGIYTDQQRQDALEAEDRAALIAQVDGGAKNLVDAPSGSGIRFINIPIVLQPGDYYVKFKNITSTDTGASVCQFGAFAEDNSQAVTNLPQLRRGDDIGAMFTVTKQTSYVRLYASSSFAGGAGDTVTFTGCMICTAADWVISQKYVPYALSNPVLTPALIEQVDNGAKNLLNCSLITIKSDPYNSGGTSQFTWNGNVCTTPRGVTFTINSDNSIGVVATSVTAEVWFRLAQNFQYGIGSYVISGCPSGGSTTTYFIESDNLNARDTGSSIVINRNSAYTDNIFLVVKSGTTFTGAFKPMICTAADYAISPAFVPYRPSWQELYEMIQALQNGA